MARWRCPVIERSEQVADTSPMRLARTASIFLRSLLFALGQWSSTLLFAPLTLLTLPLPFAWRYRVASQWSRFNLWWLAVTCALRHTVEGWEHIPQRPAVVLCKHQSAWEALALQMLFQPQVWVLKRELLWVPFFGWGLAALRPIAIDRDSGTRAIHQVVEEGIRRLAGGIWVVIFPEGTRVAPGQRGRYRLGGAWLAQRSGAPVVPVAHNAGEYWPRNGFLKRPGTIRLVVGPAIPSQGRTAVQINAAAEAWIESTMGRISDA